MKFDTIIIGGGLSGLISGIRLTQQGQKCVIISSGQSALHFFSGSFDLLNFLPDGTLVKNPVEAIDKLTEQAPEHPYVKMGKSKFSELAELAEKFLGDIDIKAGGNSNENHFRITPMGILKPTWLTLSEFATSKSSDSLPWKKVSIFNIEGFLDFQPNFISDSFNDLGIETNIHTFNLPELDILRRNPSEFRSVNLARVFDDDSNQNTLAEIFIDNSRGCEAIIFPACIGFDSVKILPKLIEKVGKPIFLVPTMPPSLIGIRTQQYLREYFKKLGGVYMLGDNVVKGEMENNKIGKIYTQNHGDIPFTADNIILSTGSFFSQGIIADFNKVYEPVFDLDVDYLENRGEWYQRNLFDHQNYQKFGVKTTQTFNGMKNNQPIENLYISGAVLSNFSPIKEGCGAGVSILSALYVSEQILTKEKAYEPVIK